MTRDPRPLKPFCRDCKFIQVKGERWAEALCGNPRLQNSRVDYVSGAILDPAPFLCSHARGVSSLCGTHGRHFVAASGNRKSEIVNRES